MDWSKPLVNKLGIVIHLDIMLDNRWIYNANFLIRPSKYIAKFLKKGGEAGNFLKSAISSALDVFHGAYLD